MLKKHSLPIYGQKVELISRLQKGIESLANVFSKKTAEDEAIRGPGSYDVVKNAFSRSVSHNRTFTAAVLSKRPENMFGIKDIPGP